MGRPSIFSVEDSATYGLFYAANQKAAAAAKLSRSGNSPAAKLLAYQTAALIQELAKKNKDVAAHSVARAIKQPGENAELRRSMSHIVHEWATKPEGFNPVSLEQLRAIEARKSERHAVAHSH